jgi:hypothetical protein
MLLDMIGIVDAVQPCPEVDDSNFAIARYVEDDLGNLVIGFQRVVVRCGRKV